jgi:hypothetical protein
MPKTENGEITVSLYYYMASSEKDNAISYVFSKKIDVSETRILPEVSAKFCGEEYSRLWQLGLTILSTINSILEEAKEQN